MRLAVWIETRIWQAALTGADVGDDTGNAGDGAGDRAASSDIARNFVSCQRRWDASDGTGNRAASGGMARDVHYSAGHLDGQARDENTHIHRALLHTTTKKEYNFNP